jgi:membrane protein YqaA with SNARE-associated domain
MALMAKTGRGTAWRLAAILTGVVLLTMLVGVVLGSVVGYWVGAPYDRTDDSFDMFREMGKEWNGAEVGLLGGLLVGSAWAFVLVTGRKRDE